MQRTTSAIKNKLNEQNVYYIDKVCAVLNKPLSSICMMHSLMIRGISTPSGWMLRCTASSIDTPNTGSAEAKAEY